MHIRFPRGVCCSRGAWRGVWAGRMPAACATGWLPLAGFCVQFFIRVSVQPSLSTQIVRAPARPRRTTHRGRRGSSATGRRLSAQRPVAVLVLPACAAAGNSAGTARRGVRARAPCNHRAGKGRGLGLGHCARRSSRCPVSATVSRCGAARAGPPPSLLLLSLSHSHCHDMYIRVLLPSPK